MNHSPSSRGDYRLFLCGKQKQNKLTQNKNQLLIKQKVFPNEIMAFRKLRLIMQQWVRLFLIFVLKLYTNGEYSSHSQVYMYFRKA